MAAIELRNVTKKFATADGGTYTAIQDLSLTVEDGQFCAVVGPTGCGKSTTLTLVSGLERPSCGGALVHGEPAAAAALKQRVEQELGWQVAVAQLGERIGLA